MSEWSRQVEEYTDNLTLKEEEELFYKKCDEAYELWVEREMEK